MTHFLFDKRTSVPTVFNVDAPPFAPQNIAVLPHPAYQLVNTLINQLRLPAPTPGSLADHYCHGLLSVLSQAPPEPIRLLVQDPAARVFNPLEQYLIKQGLLANPRHIPMSGAIQSTDPNSHYLTGQIDAENFLRHHYPDTFLSMRGAREAWILRMSQAQHAPIKETKEASTATATFDTHDVQTSTVVHVDQGTAPESVVTRHRWTQTDPSMLDKLEREIVALKEEVIRLEAKAEGKKALRQTIAELNGVIQALEEQVRLSQELVSLQDQLAYARSAAVVSPSLSPDPASLPLLGRVSPPPVVDLAPLENMVPPSLEAAAIAAPAVPAHRLKELIARLQDPSCKFSDEEVTFIATLPKLKDIETFLKTCFELERVTSGIRPVMHKLVHLDSAHLQRPGPILFAGLVANSEVARAIAITKHMSAEDLLRHLSFSFPITPTESTAEAPIPPDIHTAFSQAGLSLRNAPDWGVFLLSVSETLDPYLSQGPQFKTLIDQLVPRSQRDVSEGLNSWSNIMLLSIAALHKTVVKYLCSRQEKSVCGTHSSHRLQLLASIFKLPKNDYFEKAMTHFLKIIMGLTFHSNGGFKRWMAQFKETHDVYVQLNQSLHVPYPTKTLTELIDFMSDFMHNHDRNTAKWVELGHCIYTLKTLSFQAAAEDETKGMPPVFFLEMAKLIRFMGQEPGAFLFLFQQLYEIFGPENPHLDRAFNPIPESSYLDLLALKDYTLSLFLSMIILNPSVPSSTSYETLNPNKDSMMATLLPQLVRISPRGPAEALPQPTTLVEQLEGAHFDLAIATIGGLSAQEIVDQLSETSLISTSLLDISSAAFIRALSEKLLPHLGQPEHLSQINRLLGPEALLELLRLGWAPLLIPYSQAFPDRVKAAQPAMVLISLLHPTLPERPETLQSMVEFVHQALGLTYALPPITQDQAQALTVGLIETRQRFTQILEGQATAYTELDASPTSLHEWLQANPAGKQCSLEALSDFGIRLGRLQFTFYPTEGRAKPDPTFRRDLADIAHAHANDPAIIAFALLSFEVLLKECPRVAELPAYSKNPSQMIRDHFETTDHPSLLQSLADQQNTLGLWMVLLGTTARLSTKVTKDHLPENSLEKTLLTAYPAFVRAQIMAEVDKLRAAQAALQ